MRFLYGDSDGRAAWRRIENLMDEFSGREGPRAGEVADGAGFTEKDVALITYADQVQSPGEPPLRVLADFLRETVGDDVSILHVLPFFPYSSDDGFSVMDYKEVNPEYGSWEDVKKLGEDFDLMFDLVINHVSRESKWFSQYQDGNPDFSSFFIDVDPSWDLSGVLRPRDNPLTTEAVVDGEEKELWSTFTRDQIDLNYGNPDVLVKMIDILLFYVARGAKVIRLDAVAYLWKKPGTSCIHLEETHRLVKLFRAVLDEVAPEVALITETNVPHEHNVSYFGDEGDEAQLVYQFPLPPLVLDAFQTGNASYLNAWARELDFPGTSGGFLNFLASHDGIGLRPAEGVLPSSSIDRMVDLAVKHGGAVSYRADRSGGKSPYELNISYFDALSDPNGSEPLGLQVDRFIASQAINLAFKGLPGIYFHSLYGSRNWSEGVKRTGRKRSINRERLRLSRLEEELSREDSTRSRVLRRFKSLLEVRRNNRAFHPDSDQKVLDLSPEVVGISRIPEDKGEAVLCLHNVSSEMVEVSLGRGLEVPEEKLTPVRDLLSGKEFRAGPDGTVKVGLPPYGVRWLKGKPA